MPTLQKLFYLDIDITPEKFIGNCSEVELQETILLANVRLNRLEKTPAKPPEQKAEPDECTPPPPPEEIASPKKKTKERHTDCLGAEIGKYGNPKLLTNK